MTFVLMFLNGFGFWRVDFCLISLTKGHLFVLLKAIQLFRNHTNWIKIPGCQLLFNKLFHHYNCVFMVQPLNSGGFHVSWLKFILFRSPLTMFMLFKSLTITQCSGLHFKGNSAETLFPLQLDVESHPVQRARQKKNRPPLKDSWKKSRLAICVVSDC